MSRVGTVATLVVAVVVAAGCRAASTPVPASGQPAVSGIIVAVDAAGLTDVRGFTLRLADGSTMGFRLGALDDPTAFPPGHLKEHMATSEPVRVLYTVGPDGPVAYHLDDASEASPAAS